MAVTILRRKALRNQTRAVNRLNKIKDLMRKPEVRNVDVDAIKAEFAEMKKQREADEKKADKPTENKKVEAAEPKKAEEKPVESKKAEAPEEKKAEPKAKEDPKAEAKAAEEPKAEAKPKAEETKEENAKK